MNPRGTTVMDGWRESDSPRVSAKLPNKGLGAPRLAEGVERRGLAKGNLVEHPKGRTQRRETLPQARDWVRQALCACASSPKTGARCGRAARRDLCGECWVTGIPTATPSESSTPYGGGRRRNPSRWKSVSMAIARCIPRQRIKTKEVQSV